MMRKIIYLFICTLFIFASCSDDHNNEDYKTFSVAVQLVYPTESKASTVEGVKVKLGKTNDSGSFESKTDANGKVVFTVPAGIYEISATEHRIVNNKRLIFNGLISGLVVNDSWIATNTQELELQHSESAQIIIKELYVGGCQKDDGSGSFNYDKYAILYNNSEEEANLGEMALAMTMPYNSSGTNRYYENGKLLYASLGWIPAGQAIWYFQQNVSIAPGKQIVIALANALNNTLTYNQSINFDNAEYYCTYDNSVFTHALTYPAPVASIPTSHYLKAVSYGAGTAWPLSMFCPAFFLFTPEGTTAKDFASDVSKNDLYGGSSMLVSKKVPTEWITDGLEVFTTSYAGNNKRLTPTVDAGYVYLTVKQGYSIYRNVDKEATEAIEDNKTKLIYGYSYGTTNVDKGTTDPSGIDAEASIKNGARIIYKDTNNSSDDFHQRRMASLRK